MARHLNSALRASTIFLPFIGLLACSESKPEDKGIAFGKGHVIYSAEIQREEAQALGDMLVREKYFRDTPATVICRHQNGSHNVRFVVRDDTANNNPFVAERFRSLAALICKECLHTPEVTIELCDKSLKTLRTIPFKDIPPEYSLIASHLAHSLKAKQGDFRNDKSMPEVIAEAHSALMDLRAAKPQSDDLRYIAKEAENAFTDAIRCLSRLNAIPKPRDTSSIFVESFIHGLYGNVYAGYALGADADAKKQAIVAELESLMAASDKVEAAHLLLPKVAERYASPRDSIAVRLMIDFDESWYSSGPYDWCYMKNIGETLRDCTVLLAIKGSSGQSKQSVYFVKEWPRNTKLCARLDPGKELNGRIAGRMSVIDVDSLDVTLISPAHSSKVHYEYLGSERDKDIEFLCNDIKLSWRYQPFEKGRIFPDTQRGVKLALKNYPYLGKCSVAVTFKRGEDAKSWHYDISSWKQGEEKSFNTPPGELEYDPEKVTVEISFPRTDHKARWELKIR